MAADPTLLLVAGEASGDLHTADLARALRARRPGVRLLGMGGPAMAAAGVDLRFPLTDLAVMGFVEVLAHAGAVRRAWRAALDLLDRQRPAALVLVDYPGFNLRLARAAHRRGIPVVYYISPQLWAWKPGRVRIVRECVRRMLVILPFEVEWYAQHGVEAVFVGHPLVDRIPAPIAERPVGDPPTVALMPGSRKSDWQRLYPVLAGAAERIAAQVPGTRFVLPLAKTASRGWLDMARPLVPLEVIGPEPEARAGCDAAAIKSGTTTVENALLGLPSVIVYRTSPLSYALARRLVKVERIGMVNLIAGRDVCPERIQHDATPQSIAGDVVSLLQDEARRRTMREGMRAVRAALGEPGASDRAAAEVLGVACRRPSTDVGMSA